MAGPPCSWPIRALLRGQRSLTSAFGEVMTIAFRAKFVACTDAMGGEILQVCFDTVRQSEDEAERSTPYVLISRNFEFPDSPTIEWYDGKDYDGGAEIASLTLTRNRAAIKLDRDLDIDVTFCVGDRRFGKLCTYLRRMLDEAVFSGA